LKINQYIRVAQEILGYWDLSATMIFTHVLNKPGIRIKRSLDGNGFLRFAVYPNHAG
jgi:hypothetical protein